MLFWVIAAILTAIVTLALLGPVLRARSNSASAPEAHDVEVYRDQLAEVDRDLADGLVDPAQAEVARTEISRRLLAAARKIEEPGSEPTPDDGASQGKRLRQAVVVAVSIFMPLVALTAYLELGRPGMPQLPLAQRLQADPETADVAMLIARAETHLKQNPDDGRGWAVLGPIYLRTGRFDDAAQAFNKSIALLGPSSARLASLGEALFSAAGGVVTEEAGLAFQTARELDPNDPRPQFFLALGMAQSGKRDEARQAFQAMLDTAPADAPWIEAVQGQIASLSETPAPFSGPVSGAGAAAPGNPTAADIAAAQDMSPEDRQAMIASMIEGLEARLADNPENIEGWLRLVRSHVVTGNRERAQVALDRAFSVFEPGGAENQALAALAAELGLAITSTLGGVPVAANAPEQTTAQPAAPAQPADSPFILDRPLSQAAEGAASPQAPGNPTQADIAAAADMSADDRKAMILQMVTSLDQKLTDNPDNIEGWLRLVRSYSVLGDRDAAQTALKRAIVTFPSETDGGKALGELAAQLGLETTMENR